MIAVSRICESCGYEIPTERLEVLPSTRTCVSCSKEPKKVGFMVFDHKTGGTPVFINPNDQEALRQAKRANRRAR